LRSTRLANLVNEMDPKLVAAVFGPPKAYCPTSPIASI